MIDMTEDIYWEDTEYIKLNRRLLISLGFPLGDIGALSDIGLPDWAAPNINFDYYEAEKNRLKLGEDRNDKDIFVSFSSFKVLVGDNEKMVNSSALQLRKALQKYAIMVERALLQNDNAVIENQIAGEFIEEFRLQLSELDPSSILAGTFWSEEINRLSSHLTDS